MFDATLFAILFVFLILFVVLATWLRVEINDRKRITEWNERFKRADRDMSVFSSTTVKSFWETYGGTSTNPTSADTRTIPYVPTDFGLPKSKPGDKYRPIVAERTAFGLLKKSYPDIAKVYRGSRRIRIPSKLFPMDYVIRTDEWSSGWTSYELVHCHKGRQTIGCICLDFGDDLPRADKVLQVVSLIDSGRENEILIRGHWNGVARDLPYESLFHYFNP